MAQDFEQEDPVVLLFESVAVWGCSGLGFFFPPLPSFSVSFLILFNDFPRSNRQRTAQRLLLPAERETRLREKGTKGTVHRLYSSLPTPVPW